MDVHNGNVEVMCKIPKLIDCKTGNKSIHTISWTYYTLDIRIIYDIVAVNPIGG